MISEGGPVLKLIIAIVHDEDGYKVTDELNKNGFLVTRLATTGGFLRVGNTTLLIGTEPEKVDDVIRIIEKKCKARKQVATSPIAANGVTGVFMPYPVEVVVGGATIFVVDVDRFEKV